MLRQKLQIWTLHEPRNSMEPIVNSLYKQKEHQLYSEIQKTSVILLMSLWKNKIQSWETVPRSEKEKKELILFDERRTDIQSPVQSRGRMKCIFWLQAGRDNLPYAVTHKALYFITISLVSSFPSSRERREIAEKMWCQFREKVMLHVVSSSWHITQSRLRFFSPVQLLWPFSS